MSSVDAGPGALGRSLDDELATLIADGDLRVPAGATVRSVDPVLPTAVRVGDAAALALGALASAIAEVHAVRTGVRPTCRIDGTEAVAAVMSLFHTWVDGRPLVPTADDQPGTDMSHTNPTVDLYRTRDDRWIHLHGAFDHLTAATLHVLGCERDRAAIESAVAERDGAELEAALAAAGTCGALARTSAEWSMHPQAQALQRVGPLDIAALDESTHRHRPPPHQEVDRPLDGVRVLDFTRVIAGPTVGKLLAAHGADVLHVTAPDLDDFPTAVIDTGHGKSSAHADLRRADDAARVRALVADADIVVDSARAGSLRRHGFGAEQLAAMRPGLVVVSVNCYGFVGDWVGRPGFDHLAQTVAGLATFTGDERPVLVPAPVCDSVAGYFAAAGAVSALLRSWQHGGSHHVTTSLTQAAMFVDGLGRVDGGARGYDVDEHLIRTVGPFGELTHLRPPFRFPELKSGWTKPVVPRGSGVLGWSDSSSVVGPS